MEKLARYVDKEEKIWMKLIVSAHLVERISQVASTALSGKVRCIHIRIFPRYCIPVFPCIYYIGVDVADGRQRKTFVTA